MQSMKVVVWVLAASLGATVLMFGASSLIRARGAGSGADAGIEQSIDDVVQRRYVRLCKRNQWSGIIDLAEFTVTTVRYLRQNAHEATPMARAFLMEQLGIAGVLGGDSWSEIRTEWRKALFRDLHTPTRKQLAETTEWCVRNLTSEGRRWIEAATG